MLKDFQDSYPKAKKIKQTKPQHKINHKKSILPNPNQTQKISHNPLNVKPPLIYKIHQRPTKENQKNIKVFREREEKLKNSHWKQRKRSPKGETHCPYTQRDYKGFETLRPTQRHRFLAAAHLPPLPPPLLYSFSSQLSFSASSEPIWDPST